MILEAEKANLHAELTFYKRELAKLCLMANVKFPIFRPPAQLMEDESLYGRSSKFTVTSGFESHTAKGARVDPQTPSLYQLNAHMLYGQAAKGAVTQYQTIVSNEEERALYRSSGQEDQVSTSVS